MCACFFFLFLPWLMYFFFLLRRLHALFYVWLSVYIEFFYPPPLQFSYACPLRTRKHRINVKLGVACTPRHNSHFFKKNMVGWRAHQASVVVRVAAKKPYPRVLFSRIMISRQICIIHFCKGVILHLLSQPRPQGFFLREKPWGRGCFYHWKLVVLMRVFMFIPSLWCGASTLLHEILISRHAYFGIPKKKNREIKVTRAILHCREHNMTRKSSELRDSHYINNQERTSLLSLERLQNHIFAVYFSFVQSL